MDSAACLRGNAALIAQPVQLAAEHQALDGRPAERVPKMLGGTSQGRVFRRAIGTPRIVAP